MQHKQKWYVYHVSFYYDGAGSVASTRLTSRRQIVSQDDYAEMLDELRSRNKTKNVVPIAVNFLGIEHA